MSDTPIHDAQAPVHEHRGEDLDAIRAEVDRTLPPAPDEPAEGEPEPLPEGAVRVPLGGEHIYVFPTGTWRSSSMTLLRQGDFDGWAEKCLARVADLEVWAAMNDGDGPTNDEITAMFDELERITGQSGKSSGGSRRSLSRIRRR